LADDSEKTEEPTPKRRREAREKGQVLKSKEVNLAVLVLVSAYALAYFGPGMYEKLFKLFVQTLEELPYTLLTPALAVKYFIRYIVIMILTCIPILFSVYIAALLVETLQVGILFTTKTLKPDLNKINPIKGFKRIISLKSVVELVKGFVKTLVIGWVAYTVLRDNMFHIIATVREPPEVAFALVGDLVLRIAKKVAGAMIIIACIDYFYQRWEFEKSLKMSKQEVKDEYKQTEGDPHIKAKQRQKQRQIARGQVKSAVQSSSAVVTNPTHYAIGIKYESGMEAPLITVKGLDALAIYIRELAEKADIPIFEDKELARALYPVCMIDRPIPPEFYMAVAQIVAQLIAQKKDKSMIDALNNQMKKASQDFKRERSGSNLSDIYKNPPQGGGNNNPTGGQSGPSSIFD
jgi:flagellar biosynthetic protein FlhB